MRYLKAAEKLEIHFHWIKGHNGHPENERCDQLAVNAAEGQNLLIDTFFEESQASEELF